MAVTQPGHMQPKARPAAASSRPRRQDSETTLDGNGVVLEDEMVKLTEARMDYDAAIGFYQKSLDMLKLAVRASRARAEEELARWPTSPSAGAAQSIAVSALRAQQARMRIIAENLANANSTSSTAGGDPYRRQAPVFQADQVGRRHGREDGPRRARPDALQAPTTTPATRRPTPRAM